MGLLRALQPEWWFSAHLHVRFEASVRHGEQVSLHNSSAAGQNPDEIAMDDEFLGDEENPTREPVADNRVDLPGENAENQTPSLPAPKVTKFLALDKCLPRRNFLEVSSLHQNTRCVGLLTTLLQVVDIPLPSGETAPIDPNTPKLAFDPEWLAITRAFHPYMTRRAEQTPFPAEGLVRQMVKDEIEWVIRNVGNKEGSINVLDYQQFEKTAPGPGNEGSARNRQRMWAIQMNCLLLAHPLVVSALL